VYSILTEFGAPMKLVMLIDVIYEVLKMMDVRIAIFWEVTESDRSV
jgi:hypothetical protein